MRKLLPIAFILAILALIAVGVIYTHTQPSDQWPVPQGSLATSPSPIPSGSPGLLPSPNPSGSPAVMPMPSSNPHPDLTVDDSGLSKATVTLMTSKGAIKFKLYPQDAPNTVNRIVELINQHFYNGLTWHRVEPGFVIQSGDPLGSGMGGSGKKLKAEFNNHRHIEGTVAMARSSGDPNSADSQFYISLGTFPHLDHSYTVFGQVIEGLDVAHKIQVGDKIVWAVIQ